MMLLNNDAIASRISLLIEIRVIIHGYLTDLCEYITKKCIIQ
jgi:hypothetical protein